MSASGREAPPTVQEWSGGPPKSLGVVRWTSWMSRSARDTIPDVW